MLFYQKFQLYPFYSHLIGACWRDIPACRKSPAFRYLVIPVEVGVRGVCAQSVHRLMTAVGTTGRDRRKAIWKLSQAAERASSWLWIRRMEWKPSTNTQWLITTVGPPAIKECSWNNGPKHSAGFMLKMLSREAVNRQRQELTQTVLHTLDNWITSDF